MRSRPGNKLGAEVPPLVHRAAAFYRFNPQIDGNSHRRHVANSDLLREDVYGMGRQCDPAASSTLTVIVQCAFDVQELQRSGPFPSQAVSCPEGRKRAGSPPRLTLARRRFAFLGRYRIWSGAGVGLRRRISGLRRQ